MCWPICLPMRTHRCLAMRRTAQTRPRGRSGTRSLTRSSSRSSVWMERRRDLLSADPGDGVSVATSARSGLHAGQRPLRVMIRFQSPPRAELVDPTKIRSLINRCLRLGPEIGDLLTFGLDQSCGRSGAAQSGKAQLASPSTSPHCDRECDLAVAVESRPPVTGIGPGFRSESNAGELPTRRALFDSTPPKSLALLACWVPGFLARATATR